MNGFLTVDDMMKATGKSRRTIQRYCRERKIPHVKLGRDYLFTEAQLAEIGEAYTVAPVTAVPEAEIVNPAYHPRSPVVVPMKRPA